MIPDWLKYLPPLNKPIRRKKKITCFTRFPAPGFPRLLAPFTVYRISSNNSPGLLFLCSHQKGVIIRGKAIILTLTGRRALNILSYFPIKHKIVTPNNGLFKYSKFSSLINFHSLNRHWSILLDNTILQLDKEEMKGREDGKRSAEGRLFKGGDCVKHFRHGGINRGAAIIRENTVRSLHDLIGSVLWPTSELALLF